MRDGDYAVGRAVRVRVLARDVSIALEPVSGTSIQNCLPATVVAMANESHPALALLRLDLGGVPLVARITRRSADRLGLVTGMAVWAQIKAVAVIA